MIAYAVKGSRDNIEMYFVFGYVNPRTNLYTEEAIDLSGMSLLKLRYKKRDGTWSDVTLTADGDQVTNKGIATGQWGDGEPPEDGTTVCILQYTDGTGYVHKTGEFTMEVEYAPA